MKQFLKAFNYSGSKTRYLQYYRPIPASVDRIVEPYLGSGAFVLNAMHFRNLEGIGYDVSPEVIAIYRWLKECKPQDIYDLDYLVRDTYKRCGRFDIRTLDIPYGALQYVRIHQCTVMRGIFRGYYYVESFLGKRQTEYKLPIVDTIKCLPVIRRLELVHGSGDTHVEGSRDGWFIDPPYLDESRGDTVNNSGYSDAADGYTTDDTLRLIERINRPACMTYGSAAKRTFTKLDWQLVKVKGVAALSGASKWRVEYVTYMNGWN